MSHKSLTERVLLSDGTRALTSAGRWAEAASQARQHNGIGQRLLDGRQILVLAQCQNSDYAAAFTTLASAATPTGWEQAVAACLEGMRRTWSGEPAGVDAAAAISSYFSAARSGDPALFRVRLASSAIDFPGPTQPTVPPEIAQLAADEALDSRDAYAARDVITNPALLRHIKPHTARLLRGIVRESGIMAGALPATHMEDLMRAVWDSETVISGALRTERLRQNLQRERADVSDCGERAGSSQRPLH